MLEALRATLDPRDERQTRMMAVLDAAATGPGGDVKHLTSAVIGALVTFCAQAGGTRGEQMLRACIASLQLALVEMTADNREGEVH
jgi:hypothetical protein